jgi:hypothetical protein
MLAAESIANMMGIGVRDHVAQLDDVATHCDGHRARDAIAHVDDARPAW